MCTDIGIGNRLLPVSRRFEGQAAATFKVDLEALPSLREVAFPSLLAAGVELKGFVSNALGQSVDVGSVARFLLFLLFSYQYPPSHGLRRSGK